jgi:hypothetical protein
MSHCLKIIFVALAAWSVSFCFFVVPVAALGWSFAVAYSLAGAGAGAAAIQMHRRMKTERAQLAQA